MILLALWMAFFSLHFLTLPSLFVCSSVPKLSLFLKQQPFGLDPSYWACFLLPSPNKVTFWGTGDFNIWIWGRGTYEFTYNKVNSLLGAVLPITIPGKGPGPRKLRDHGPCLLGLEFPFCNTFPQYILQFIRDFQYIVTKASVSTWRSLSTHRS